MTTIGQIAYERRYRRDPEAPAWDLLPQCLKSPWEHAAAAVADAVQPTMELLRARVIELSQAYDAAAIRAANAETQIDELRSALKSSQQRGAGLAARVLRAEGVRS